MAKTFSVVALVATALCLSSIIGSAYCHDGHLHLIGQVFCDPCRVSFETTASYPLAGAQVKLVCTNRTSGVVKETIQGTTDDKGAYQLTIDGDHADEICEVEAIKSPDPQCSSLVPEAIKNARISLARESGVAIPDRFANPLFYSPEKSLESCPKILLDMGILPPGTDDFYY
ncbi:hypothetical protein MLD38_027084 [Melastoma candidum]|uniref:Uncharacterized protein n=1 Tax=Melastoma candidum TaxID=119954 RepID=A0ACB9P1M7_9MYRT|nr:hypothetical protein MLD38_027084 [Melastoma candidum]